MNNSRPSTPLRNSIAASAFDAQTPQVRSRPTTPLRNSIGAAYAGEPVVEGRSRPITPTRKSVIATAPSAQPSASRPTTPLRNSIGPNAHSLAIASPRNDSQGLNYNGSSGSPTPTVPKELPGTQKLSLSKSPVGTPEANLKRKSAPLVSVIYPKMSGDSGDLLFKQSSLHSSTLSFDSTSKPLSSSNLTSSSQQQPPSNKGIAFYRFSKKADRLGITRSMNCGVSFEAILAGNWKSIDNIFYGKYHLFPVESVHFRPPKKHVKRSKAQIHDAVYEEVGEAVVKACQTVNRKRQKFLSLCLKSPYIPCVYKNYVTVSSAVGNILAECFSNEHQQYVWFPRITVLSLGLLPMCLVLFLLVGLLFGGLIGLVWDLATFRYFLRFSEYEKRWIQKLLSDYPELNGDVIEAALKMELQTACDSIMKKYPDCNLKVWSGLERIDHWNLFFETYYEFTQRFVIVVNPPSESVAQLLYQFQDV